MSKRFVKWEKFENVISEGVLNFKRILATKMPELETEHSQFDDYADDDDEEDYMPMIRVPITPDLLSSVKLSSSFNCWYLHTSFPIRESTIDQLDNARGIEMVKVVSRYRYLIAIGQAFELKDVRQEIENILGVGL